MRADSIASGLVIVDKPSGLTSHDVVARIRRLAGTRKVGHAGTLDPMATGVLLVGVNKATRLLGHLMLTEKAYDATVRLGASTSTDDAEGEPLSRASAAHLEVDEVRAASLVLVGDIEQVPSSVSAIKIDGQRAYKRVLAGESFDLPARPVTVHSLTVGEARREGDFLDVDVSVRCSSGTYIRAIARDLGASLGVGGHLTRLRRTAVGVFDLSESVPLADMEAAGQVQLVALGAVAGRCFPVQQLDDASARDVSFGRRLELRLPDVGPVALLAPDQSFLALYEQSGAFATPVAVFV